MSVFARVLDAMASSSYCPIILKQGIRLKSIKEAELLRCALNCLYVYSIDVAQGREILRAALENLRVQ